MSSKKHKKRLEMPVWISKTLFESMLIVLSILLALAVAEYQEDDELEQLIVKSLASFEHEIVQNKSRIEDIYPFHVGLQSILSELQAQDGAISAEELREVVDSFQSTVLLTSAWDTAVATGALSSMDYQAVSALSLTYSIQRRYQDLNNAGVAELINATKMGDENRSTAVYIALRYMREVTTAEQELRAVYQQALELIQENRNAAAENQ